MMDQFTYVRDCYGIWIFCDNRVVEFKYWNAKADCYA